MGTLLLNMGCKKQFADQAPAEQSTSTATERETKLGELKPNIYSFSNVQKALNGLLSAKSGSAGSGISQQAVINPSHLYVRFAPQTMEQLLRLEEADFVLYDVPLTADIEVEGDYYQDPAIPEDQITYQYTLVPDGYPLPTDIPYTVLDQIFLYTDDDGEAQEPDPWAGGELCENWDPLHYACFVPEVVPGPNQQRAGGAPLLQLRQFYSAKGDAVRKATSTIKMLGIRPADLYDATAKLIKFDPDTDGAELAQHNSERYRPEGFVSAFNTELSANVPLYGIQIRSRNFLKLGVDFTNENGYFRITKGYKKRANVKAVCRNGLASVRSLHTWWQPWRAVLTTRHTMGNYSRTALENVNFVFVRDPNSGTHTARKWAAFTALSTLAHAWVKNNADDFPYNFPYVKLLLTDAPTETGIAPMSTYLIKQQTGAAEVRVFFGALKDVIKKELKIDFPFFSDLLKAAADAVLPDLVYAYGGPNGTTTLSSRALQNGIYRQAGRATHYYALFKTISPLGDAASNYWWTVQKQMFANRVNNDAPPFGQKTGPHAGKIAVIESYAYYYGNLRNSERYSTPIFSPLGGLPYRDAERNQIENSRVRNNVAIAVMGSGLNTWYEGWIPCGLLHDVGDVGENSAFTGITDAANEYGRQRIYYAVKSAAHNDVNSFVNGLLNTGALLQEAQVRSLQTQYGY